MLGKKFTVTAVLPETGTVDDSRIFAHLHTVQDLTKKGPVVNAIEIIGCCQEISAGLVDKLNATLPDAKVVTVAQIVKSQQNINRMMSNLSLMFLVIIVFVGGASIANYMYANVFERRREIGTLMALGADSRLVLKVFLLKALLAWGRGRSRRLRAWLDFRRGAGPAVGRHTGVADVAVGDCGHCHFCRPHVSCEFLPRPERRPPGARSSNWPCRTHSRRSDPC